MELAELPPAGVRRLADGFWAAAGGAGAFPRDLAAVIPFALPVTPVPLAELDLAGVQGWLARRRLVGELALPGPNRRLHGCLVAAGGHGILFWDAADPLDEQRLSLAHEVAHFLADYQAPRARLARHLGPPALAVLERQRAATADERALAALLGVSLAPLVHLLTRDPAGWIVHAEVAQAERRAHQLALELLAPADAVAERARATPAPERGPRRLAHLAALLVRDFGLPADAAGPYARALAGPAAARSAGEWLGLP